MHLKLLTKFANNFVLLVLYCLDVNKRGKEFLHTLNIILISNLLLKNTSVAHSYLEDKGKKFILLLSTRVKVLKKDKW